ncbi:MAG: glycosyltransferase, partial [Anaerolineae bacterium]
IKSHTIWNGFDSEAFKPDTLAGLNTRQALGIPPDAPVIGMIARDHPQKDIENFINAASILSRKQPSVRFILCGSGIDTMNQRLTRLRDDFGLRDTCLLLGIRNDVGAIYNTFDVATLSSLFGEALPLVIGEAMACGVPCVATDVGDSAKIIGDTGLIVPPRSPDALAEAWLRILSLSETERRALGLRARDRIIKQYSIGPMVQSYMDLYRQVLATQPVRKRHGQGDTASGSLD